MHRPKLPDYLKRPIASLDNQQSKQVREILKRYNLNTVCDGARCPNKCECYSNLSATFLIMGKTCTRNCAFCNIEQQVPEHLDPDEPKNVALTPDFCGSYESLNMLLQYKPDVFNHNIETVKNLYPKARQMADYNTSLAVLKYIKENSPDIITKTGLMVGLGESKDELYETFCDIKKAKVDILTLGQYISPSKKHLTVEKYYTISEFSELENLANKAGIKYTVFAPLARSSYKASQAYYDIVSKK